MCRLARPRDTVRPRDTACRRYQSAEEPHVPVYKPISQLVSTKCRIDNNESLEDTVLKIFKKGNVKSLLALGLYVTLS